MMEMRASRMMRTFSISTKVHAADSLLKLVSELKQTAMFSGFASPNDHGEQRTEEFTEQAEKTECMLSRIGEEAAASHIIILLQKEPVVCLLTAKKQCPKHVYYQFFFPLGFPSHLLLLSIFVYLEGILIVWLMDKQSIDEKANLVPTYYYFYEAFYK
ncbi:hypothetical protein P3S68_006461 [Capsicum galapagoense]